mmetsp:Transcript_46425/g.77048  ORF Transcript_46425/g.77048 Transcript_46425/m.77048 type:complete len:301 (-) Transcript_46425:81-983(-)
MDNKVEEELSKDDSISAEKETLFSHSSKSLDCSKHNTAVCNCLANEMGCEGISTVDASDHLSESLSVLSMNSRSDLQCNRGGLPSAVSLQPAEHAKKEERKQAIGVPSTVSDLSSALVQIYRAYKQGHISKEQRRQQKLVLFRKYDSIGVDRGDMPPEKKAFQEYLQVELTALSSRYLSEDNFIAELRCAQKTHDHQLCSCWAHHSNRDEGIPGGSKSPEYSTNEQMLDLLGFEPVFTNKTHNFTGTLDYVFFSPEWNLCRHLGLPILDHHSEANSCFPNDLWPSDHFPVACDAALPSAF